MYEILNPRPTEPNAAVVDHPDSVTQFICPERTIDKIGGAESGTHHINVKGQCVYCHTTRIVLAKRYGFIR